MSETVSIAEVLRRDKEIVDKFKERDKEIVLQFRGPSISAAAASCAKKHNVTQAAVLWRVGKQFGPIRGMTTEQKRNVVAWLESSTGDDFRRIKKPDKITRGPKPDKIDTARYERDILAKRRTRNTIGAAVKRAAMRTSKADITVWQYVQKRFGKARTMTDQKKLDVITWLDGMGK